ncbi:MAG: very short patch repair endonuclease [Methylocapsa sp.]|nr:very short patch repair endonuclease [Methylocapsa sp.]
MHGPNLPGKPDLVFGPRRKVIFVHGCFWHFHGDPNCPDRRRPKSNLDYWEPKLARNRNRDAGHIAALEAGGWSVLVIWECETRDLATLSASLRAFLN